MFTELNNEELMLTDGGSLVTWAATKFMFFAFDHGVYVARLFCEINGY